MPVERFFALPQLEEDELLRVHRAAIHLELEAAHLFGFRFLAARDPRRHQDSQRARQGRGEPPAERRQAEQPLPGSDHDLAERRMGDVLALGTRQDVRAALGEQRIGVLDVIDLYAMLQDPVRIGDVVGLVEDHGVRNAQPVEAQERAEHGHQERTSPPPERASRHRWY